MFEYRQQKARFRGVSRHIEIAGTFPAQSDSSESGIAARLKAKGWQVVSVSAGWDGATGNIGFVVLVMGNSSDSLTAVARNFKKAMPAGTQLTTCDFIGGAIVNTTGGGAATSGGAATGGGTIQWDEINKRIAPAVPSENPQGGNYAPFTIRGTGRAKSWSAPSEYAIQLAFEKAGYGITSVAISQRSTQGMLNAMPAVGIYNYLTGYEYDILIEMVGSNQSIGAIKAAAAEHLNPFFSDLVLSVKIGNAGALDKASAFLNGLGIGTPVAIAALIVVGVIFLKK